MTIHVTGRDPLTFVVEDDYGLHCTLCGTCVEGHDGDALKKIAAHVEEGHQ